MGAEWLAVITVLAGSYLAIAAAKGRAGNYRWNIPPSATKLLERIDYWARERQIPTPIILAWAQLESTFRLNQYNPEKGAMSRWSCAIAGDNKWKANPNFAEAVKVCRLFDEGKEPEEILDMGLWGPGSGFGSYGLLQLSRIAASEVGYPYSGANKKLFDLETNLKYGTAEIALRRKQLYGERLNLTVEEWARVRAAYVGGPGIFKNNATKAEEIGARFLVALKDIATPQKVA